MEKLFPPRHAIRLLLFISLNFSFPLFSQNGMWAWMHGPSSSVTANYGVQGVAAPSNQPPLLYEAAEWTDQQGNFWLLGGVDASTWSEATALWKFDPVANVWTWMKGPNSNTTAGIYGVQGVAAPANYPGSRAWGAKTWTDANNNLWLFGGNGYDATGNSGVLNDLWKYDIATNEWTWMKGANTIASPGNYGTLQVAANSNEPPARDEGSSTWVSNSGELWMFGERNALGQSFNDMWKYSPVTNQWTWMSGSNTTNTPPNYGTQFIPAASNTPGARSSYSHWKDSNGNFWFFGGWDLASTNEYADMWKYDPVTNIWTWMAGSNVLNDLGTFTQTCIPGNGYPRSRYESRCVWTDDCGRFWLYGGGNYATSATNDLWMFDPSTNQFTWITGTIGYQTANYGTQLVPSTANNPESPAGNVGWRDLQGNFWTYGGVNVMWKYIPDPNCPASTLPQQTIVANASCTPFGISFSANPGGSGLIYNWDFGDTTVTSDTSSFAAPVYTYSSTGTYTVTLIVTGNASCNPGTDTLTAIIQVDSLQIPDLGNDTLICSSTFNLTLDAGVANSYTWSTGAGTQTISVTSPGTYWVTLNSATCPETDSIVIASATGPNLGPDTMLCQGIIYPLDAGVANSYQWNTGDTTQTITPVISGPYYVDVTTGNCTFHDSVNIIFTPLPLVNLGPDTTLCPNNSITLDAGNAGANFNWSTGAVTQQITVNSAGSYNVTVSQNNCTGSDTVAVNIIPALDLADTSSLCGVVNLTLDAGIADTYQWSTGATTQTITITEPGIYGVQTTSASCVQTDSIEVTGSPGEGVLYIPNTFTPDGNLLNDRFTAKGENVIDFRMRIFNRWGELIFETTDMNSGWDGRYKGRIVQQDVYVYVVDYQTSCISVHTEHRIGHVSVIR